MCHTGEVSYLDADDLLINMALQHGGPAAVLSPWLASVHEFWSLLAVAGGSHKHTRLMDVAHSLCAVKDYLLARWKQSRDGNSLRIISNKISTHRDGSVSFFMGYILNKKSIKVREQRGSGTWVIALVSVFKIGPLEWGRLLGFYWLSGNAAFGVLHPLERILFWLECQKEWEEMGRTLWVATTAVRKGQGGKDIVYEIIFLRFWGWLAVFLAY